MPALHTAPETLVNHSLGESPRHGDALFAPTAGMQQAGAHSDRMACSMGQQQARQAVAQWNAFLDEAGSYADRASVL